MTPTLLHRLTIGAHDDWLVVKRERTETVGEFVSRSA